MHSQTSRVKSHGYWITLAEITPVAGSPLPAAGPSEGVQRGCLQWGTMKLCTRMEPLPDDGLKLDCRWKPEKNLPQCQFRCGIAEKEPWRPRTRFGKTFPSSLRQLGAVNVYNTYIGKVIQSYLQHNYYKMSLTFRPIVNSPDMDIRIGPNQQVMLTHSGRDIWS